MDAFAPLVRDLALLIEFGGSLIVVLGCVRGLFALVAGGLGAHAITRTRLLVAVSVIAALGFKTAASLLKTIEFGGWQAILMFTAIFALRTVVKRALLWEEARLRAK